MVVQLQIVLDNLQDGSLLYLLGIDKSKDGDSPYRISVHQYSYLKVNKVEKLKISRDLGMSKKHRS